MDTMAEAQIWAVGGALNPWHHREHLREASQPGESGLAVLHERRCQQAEGG
jgi:hypothetical protein